MNFLDEFCSIYFLFIKLIKLKGLDENLDQTSKQELKDLLINESLYDDFDALNIILN